MEKIKSFSCEVDLTSTGKQILILLQFSLFYFSHYCRKTTELQEIINYTEVANQRECKNISEYSEIVKKEIHNESESCFVNNKHIAENKQPHPLTQLMNRIKVILLMKGLHFFSQFSD